MAFKGVTNLDPPAATIAKITFYRMGKVTDVHHDLVESVTTQLFNQVFHDRFTQDRDHRLGHLVGQWTHPGALPGRQYHRLHCLGAHPAGTRTDSTVARRLIQDRMRLAVALPHQVLRLFD